jgi:hypothetical protein
MEFTYTIPNDPITGEASTKMILRSDGTWIPADPANADYQAYLSTLPSELAEPAPAEKPKK